jgi:hypothetical protein
MIIAGSVRNNPANIGEQGLKVRRQWIAGPMEVAHHLIEVVSQANKRGIIQFFDMARGSLVSDRRISGIQKQRAAEMNRPHPESLSTPYKAFVFRRCKADIKLPVSWLIFLRATHVCFSLAERMRPGVWGPFISGPQREPFALGKRTSRYPLPPI